VSTTAVGFSPVPQGNSVITGGVTATANAEGESPLGFIDALLGMLSEGVSPDVPAATGVETEAGTEADLGALANLGLAVDTAIKSDLPATLPENGKQVLADLVAAIAAIDDAVQNGQPIDPALNKKLSETLDDLAGMLGISLPAPPAIDPAITAAAGGAVIATDAELQAGLTAENKPLPPGFEIAPPAEPADAPSSDELAEAFLDAAAKAVTPAQVEEEQPETPPATQTPAGGETEIDPESPLGRLVAKLTEIAEKLESRAPNASAKLEAVVAKLTARALDGETIAKLEADLAATDVEALLAQRPDARAADKPAPPPFTAPTLPMPEVVVQPPKQATPAPKAVEPAAPSEPELAPPEEPRVAKDARPADKPDTEPKLRERGSFASHLADARNDKAAEPNAQGQQAQSPAAQVKTELGIVTPKAVHAAYQAPVQQINVPQVAFEIVRQFNHGNSRFQIRLDPPELGRIDVRMHVDGDGNVHARMTVERAETLDLMQRDQRSLEKALAQAGLDSGKTNLEFSLRQNPFARDGQNPQHQQGNGSPFSRNAFAGSEAEPEIPSTTTQYRGLATPSGVNLFV
jgi:flagellar hook-length control protein FliK